MQEHEMREHDSTPTSDSLPQPKWQILSAIDRRVVGVLAEKAKTTPDNYPMSLNAVCTGCNQKSNRAPLMQLEADDVEQSLDRLREMGAVAMVEGYGRVTKYRHYLYDWLGVDKVELAVMTELLLRGAQAQGELRGRAARMEPIADLAALRPVIASLKNKGLVVSLTPEGRGQVVSHALYTERELEKLRAQFATDDASTGGQHRAGPPATVAAAAPVAVTAAVSPPPAAPPTASATVDLTVVETMQRSLDELKSQIAELRSEVETLATAYQHTQNELRDLRDALGG